MNPTYRFSADVQPYSIDNAIMAIENIPTSGKVAVVREISVNFQARGTSNTPGLEALSLISEHTGGTVLSIFSLDSDDTLPSQVEARTDSGYTITGTLKRGICAPMFSPARVPMGNAVLGSGNTIGNVCNIQNTLFGTDATGIILREGEGIAWHLSVPAPSSYFWVSVTFKTDQAGSPSYVTHSVYNTFAELTAGISLMNGTGSGVVVTIVNVEVHEVGTDSIPHISMIQIDGIQPQNEGTTPTTKKMDSNNPDVPSVIKVRRNCGIIHAGVRRGVDPVSIAPDGGVALYPFFLPHWYRSCRGGGKFRSYMIPPAGLNQLQGLGTGGRWLTRVFDGAMVIRPGHGVAVMCGLSDAAMIISTTLTSVTGHGNSSYSNFFVNMMVTIEDGVVPGYGA